MDLKKENEILKKRLENAQNWIKREVLSDMKMINFSKINSETSENKKNFFSENIEEIVENNLLYFFGEEIFLSVSPEIFENIISAEILFFTLRENKNLDGLGIITSYHKSFDFIVEEEITKPFRKFFNSKKLKIDLENDLLEKKLYSVIFEGHILGFGKLFGLLKNISENEKLLPYAKIFKEFLEKYSYIGNILLEKNFLEIYEKLVLSEFFGSKRHIGKVDFEDVLETRKYFLGDLKEKNSFFYKLLGVYDF